MSFIYVLMAKRLCNQSDPPLLFYPKGQSKEPNAVVLFTL